jgi:hypothetical protein
MSLLSTLAKARSRWCALVGCVAASVGACSTYYPLEARMWKGALQFAPAPSAPLLHGKRCLTFLQLTELPAANHQPTRTVWQAAARDTLCAEFPIRYGSVQESLNTEVPPRRLSVGPTYAFSGSGPGGLASVKFRLDPLSDTGVALLK